MANSFKWGKLMKMLFRWWSLMSMTMQYGGDLSLEQCSSLLKALSTLPSNETAIQNHITLFVQILQYTYTYYPPFILRKLKYTYTKLSTWKMVLHGVESVLHIIRPRSLWDIDKNPYPEASHFIMSEWGRQPVRPVRLCTIAQCVHCTVL